MTDEPWKATTDGVVVDVRLTPRGGRDAIEGVERRADGRAVLKARVRVAPADGEANSALCRLIADALDIAPRQVTVAAGATSRLKRIRVTGEPAALVRALRRLVSETADVRPRTDERNSRTIRRLSSVDESQLFQPKATLSRTRVPNFSDERATVLPPSAR